jgi:hypothetical protein
MGLIEQLKKVAATSASLPSGKNTGPNPALWSFVEGLGDDAYKL